MWGHTPLILALKRQRQVDLCEFEDSLDYMISSRIARVTQKNPVSNNNNKKASTTYHTQLSVCVERVVGSTHATLQV